MRNAKRIGRKLLASFLCVTMTAGLLTGLYTYKNNKEVKAATTGFTSNDFLKCVVHQLRIIMVKETWCT